MALNTTTTIINALTTPLKPTTFATTLNQLHMNLYGYDIDFCFIASITSESIALFQIISFILFYIYRNEDGIKSRRPVFTYSFCLISIVYFVFIIPAICSESTLNIPQFIPFIGWYLLRCTCIFLWFWTLICKYWFLYFDYNYVILLRLQAMHSVNSQKTRVASKSLFAPSTQMKSKWFAKHKKDFGNPRKASLYIGIYFLLCFLVLLCFAIIDHSKIDKKYLNKTENIYSSFFTNLQLTEITFVIMCYVPFLTALTFTLRIWHINESWKIKQEILSIFIVAAAIFLIDTVLTGWIYFDESTRFTLKLMCEALILFWTTFISTVFVTYYVLRKRNKSNRKLTNFTTNEIVTNMKASELMHIQQETDTEINMIPINDIDTFEAFEEEEIPLGYILANQIGYASFLQHCSDELNMENLLFLAHVCYFKKKFLDRIKDRQLQQNKRCKQQKNNERQSLPALSEAVTFNKEQNDIELQSIEPHNIDLENAMGDSKTSFVTILTDVAVHSDNGEEIIDKYSDCVIDWSPSNCLAILTFRMCHNFERENNRLTLIDCSDNYSENENESLNNNIHIPLYVLATNLYHKFVKESSEFEINLPSKIKRKLHFFFHQNYFKDLSDEKDMRYNEYRLFHIFDKSWEEIWHLLSLNSYRRFLNSKHYLCIRHQLAIAMCDEKPALFKLIVLDSNNDKHIATLIESHTPYKRKQIIHSKQGSNQSLNVVGRSANRMSSLNIEEMHELKPTSLINIGVEPLPIDEQIHHFGKTMTKVKKARV